MQVNSINPAFGQKLVVNKMKNPVKTSAKVCAGLGIASLTSVLGATLARKSGREYIMEIIKGSGLSKGKFAAITIAGVAMITALNAAFGAGIGAIVKACQNKKSEKAE